jgi:hypothetical protein
MQRMICVFTFMAHSGPPVVRVPDWFASLVQGSSGRRNQQNQFGPAQVRDRRDIAAMKISPEFFT